MDFKVLEWDSEVFDIPTALITRKIHSQEQLELLISKMESAGIRFAYYFSPVELGGFTEKFGGKLVDRKTTFFQRTNHLDIPQISESNNVVPYDQPNATEQMKILAIQSGAYSRFAVDPLFPRKKFELLYTIWINRAVGKEIADDVLITQQDGKITGFVTLGYENDIGEIGLIAVDAAYRRKRFGQSLVRSALTWCAFKGLDGCQVVTQGENIPACKLYTKCGFEIQKVEFVYHFWLDMVTS